MLPLPFSRGWRGRGKAGGQGDGEVCRRGRCKVASQMTTAYIVRAVERLKDVACDIRIATRDCCRVFGCTLRRHKCNFPWIKFKDSRIVGMLLGEFSALSTKQSSFGTFSCETKEFGEATVYVAVLWVKTQVLLVGYDGLRMLLVPFERNTKIVQSRSELLLRRLGLFLLVQLLVSINSLLEQRDGLCIFRLLQQQHTKVIEQRRFIWISISP